MAKRILLAIDGSDISMHAVQETVKLLQGESIQLLIIHVVEVHFMFPGIDYMSLLNLYKKEGILILDNAQKILANQYAISCDTKLIEHNLLQGRIAEVIAKEAKTWGLI